MAKAVQEGAQGVGGVEVVLRRVREFPEYVQHMEEEKGYSYQVYQSQATIPECMLDDLRAADGVIFGSPTRYGNMTAQLMVPLLHLGMLIVGVPYSTPGMIHTEARGGKPYGATTIAGPQGELQPSADDLAIARVLGRRVAETALRLRGSEAAGSR